MAPLAASVAFFLATVFLAAPEPLPLRVVSDVFACPSVHEVESALRQTLGEGDQRTIGWTLWYGRDLEAPVAEREAKLLMELVDADGERIVSRWLPTPAVDCAAIGTAIAAVVERSLRDLGWTRGEPFPESTGLPQPAGGTPAASTSTPVTPAPTKKNHGPRLVLDAGPLVATTSRLGTNLLLEARVRVAGPWCVRLGAAALAGNSDEALESGRVNLSTRTVTLSVLAASVLGPIELVGGPVALLSADKASSSNLPRSGSGARLVAAVGAGAGVALPLSRRWRIGLELDGVHVVFAPDAYVDWNGTQRRVLTPSAWQGVASAKLEFAPWP